MLDDYRSSLGDSAGGGVGGGACAGGGTLGFGQEQKCGGLFCARSSMPLRIFGLKVCYVSSARCYQSHHPLGILGQRLVSVAEGRLRRQPVSEEANVALCHLGREADVPAAAFSQGPPTPAHRASDSTDDRFLKWRSTPQKSTPGFSKG